MITTKIFRAFGVASVVFLSSLAYADGDIVSPYPGSGLRRFANFQVVLEKGFSGSSGFRVYTRDARDILSRAFPSSRYEIEAGKEEKGGKVLTLMGSIATSEGTRGYWFYYEEREGVRECLIPQPIERITASDSEGDRFILVGVGTPDRYGTAPLYLVEIEKGCRLLSTKEIPAKGTRIQVSALHRLGDRMVLMGTAWNEKKMNRDLWIVTLDGEGHLKDEILYGGDEDEVFFEESLDASGKGVLMISGTHSAGNDLDLLFLYFSPTLGRILRAQVLIAVGDQVPLELASDGGGSYTVAGISVDRSGNSSSFLLSLSPEGTLLHAQGIPSFAERSGETLGQDHPILLTLLR